VRPGIRAYLGAEGELRSDPVDGVHFNWGSRSVAPQTSDFGLVAFTEPVAPQTSDFGIVPTEATTRIIQITRRGGNGVGGAGKFGADEPLLARVAGREEARAARAAIAGKLDVLSTGAAGADVVVVLFGL